MSSFSRILDSRSSLKPESCSIASSTLSRAVSPIRQAMDTHSLMATLGVRIRRGSRKANSLAGFSVRISLRASFSSWRENGRSSSVVKTLNTVWQKAMPTAPTVQSMKEKPKIMLPP